MIYLQKEEVLIRDMYTYTTDVNGAAWATGDIRAWWICLSGRNSAERESAIC